MSQKSKVLLILGILGLSLHLNLSCCVAATLASLTPATSFAQNKPELRKRLLNVLNNMQTLRASFKEVIQKKGRKNSTPRTGTLLITKPEKGKTYGSLYLKYDAPTDLEIHVKGRTIYINQPLAGKSQTLPLSVTPLGMLLRRKITLKGHAEEVSLIENDTQFIWTLQNAERNQDNHHNQEGQVSLLFSKKSLHLEGWIIEDVFGKQTHVWLSKTKITPALY